MSAIRPPVPSPLFPAQAPPSPARASRSAFFQAALDGLASAAAPVEPGPANLVGAASAAPPPAPERSARPGALLDIRV